MNRLLALIAMLFLVNGVNAQCIDVTTVYKFRNWSIDSIQQRLSALGWEYNGETSESELYKIRYSYDQNPGDLSRATCWFRIYYLYLSGKPTLLFLTVDFTGKADYQKTLAAMTHLGFVLDKTKTFDTEISRTFVNRTKKHAGEIVATEFVTKDPYSPKAYSFSVSTEYGAALVSTVFDTLNNKGEKKELKE